MVDSIVDNMSLRTQRKGELRLEIDLAATAAQLQALTDAIRQILTVPDIENKVVFLGETGKNAHVITVEFFTSAEQPIEAFNQLRQEVNLHIINWMEQHGVGLAASNTSVTVKQA